MKRRIIHIDESRCDGCGLCTQVCSFNAIQGAVGFGGAVPAEPAIYAPNPDPFQTGPIPRVLTDEMNDFQETEIAGEPNETPGEALGAAEGVSVAERIVHSEGPTGPLAGLPLSEEGGVR